MAETDVLLLTHSMAGSQRGLTLATQQLLAILSQLPAIQDLNLPESTKIFASVLRSNNNYHNITLVDLDGQVLAAGNAFRGANLADRRHFRAALQNRRLAVGEYIITRVGTASQALPFAYPVLDKEGVPRAVLTAVIKLADFPNFLDISKLPKKSFVSITDYRGIRLLYYPAQTETNPIGKAIKGEAWQRSLEAKGDHETFTIRGSDGIRRLIAFERVRLKQEEEPYLYVWAGIPEQQILQPGNAIMIRNLYLMLLATMISLLISWLFSMNTLILPVRRLLARVNRLAPSDLVAEKDLTPNLDELGTLAAAFEKMASNLAISQKTLQESEARFRLLLNSLNAAIYVADMATYEILFVNKQLLEQVGNVTGKICWQVMQTGQSGVCPFCPNKYLLDGEGKLGKVHISEVRDTKSGQWLNVHARAIKWIDGRTVGLHVATDITSRKINEEEREQLIGQLQEALANIDTLSGLLPICASCKMIRDDNGYWNQIESYIKNHSQAEFSHGICPECAKKLYPDLVDDQGKIKSD